MTRPEVPAPEGAERSGPPAGPGVELRSRYTAADVGVFTREEASRFLSGGDGDPRGDVALAWDLLYRLEPGLYDRLAVADHRRGPAAAHRPSRQLTGTRRGPPPPAKISLM